MDFPITSEPAAGPAPDTRRAERTSLRPARGRLATALRRWWERLCMDERTAYLSMAEDLADLERRIRRWDEPDRHRIRFPLP
jgi:hypothetical protein